MKKVLIIRSASFQQLDLNLGAILDKFPEAELDLLTHEHGLVLASKYSSISKVLSYPASARFEKTTRAPDVDREDYDSALILVSNLSGAGFANVFEFAASLRTKSVYRCNMVGDIQEVSRKEIRALARNDRIFKGIALVVGTIVGLAAALWFLATICIPGFLKRKSCLTFGKTEESIR